MSIHTLPKNSTFTSLSLHHLSTPTPSPPLPLHPPHFSHSHSTNLPNRFLNRKHSLTLPFSYIRSNSIRTFLLVHIFHFTFTSKQFLIFLQNNIDNHPSSCYSDIISKRFLTVAHQTNTKKGGIE